MKTLIHYTQAKTEACEGKRRDVAYVSRPHFADGSGVPTFSDSTKKRGEKPLKVEKARAAPLKLLENLKGSAAEDEELYRDDDEYADDEYLGDLPEEAMEHLEKERKEEMAKFESELRVGKVKVKFGDFDEVNAMVVTLPLFFEARLNQPNYMDEDMFDEVVSMIQMKGAKEIEVAQEIPKERNAQPCIVVPKKEEKLPKKVCYEMPTKKMASHLKPLYVGAHFDGVLVSRVLVDTGATVDILCALIIRKLKKGSDELIPTETTVSGFRGDTTTSKGIITL
ncbi:unnamed protein product, partial [Prunus brigantina]